jgi:hypothetical protein
LSVATSTSSRFCSADTVSSAMPSLKRGRKRSPSPWRPLISATEAKTLGA